VNVMNPNKRPGTTMPPTPSSEDDRQPDLEPATPVKRPALDSHGLPVAPEVTAGQTQVNGSAMTNVLRSVSWCFLARSCGLIRRASCPREGGSWGKANDQRVSYTGSRFTVMEDANGCDGRTPFEFLICCYLDDTVFFFAVYDFICYMMILTDLKWKVARVFFQGYKRSWL